MKVTKILALAAVAVMGCAVFYGCGETTGSSSPTSSTVSSQADVASQTTSQSSEADTPVPPKDTRIVGTWKADHLIVDKKAVSVREWATAQLEQEMEIPSDIPDSLSSQKSTASFRPMRLTRRLVR